MGLRSTCKLRMGYVVMLTSDNGHGDVVQALLASRTHVDLQRNIVSVHQCQEMTINVKKYLM